MGSILYLILCINNYVHRANYYHVHQLACVSDVSNS